MAIAPVSRVLTAIAASATTVASPAQTHGAGNLICVGISRSFGVTVAGVADLSGGVNVFQKAGATQTESGSANELDIWYCYNIAGVTNNVVTVTFSGAIGYRVVVVREFSGFGTSNPFNAQAGGTNNSGTMATGSVAVSGLSAVIFAMFEATNAGITDGSPAYNTSPFNATGDPVNYFSDGYRIVSASEAATANCSSSIWVANAASFQILSATPPLTYAQLMAQPNAEFVVLSDVQVRQALRGWTSAGSGAYSVPYSDYTHPTTVRIDRGLYRGLDTVLENQSPLTLRANLAAVQANPSSYFFDVAAQTLYVKTAAGVNPDTVSLMQAVFTVCLSTHTRNFVGGRPYAKMLDGRSVPTLHAEQPDFLSGITVAPSGALSIQNADGFWDYPSAAWNWMNGVVTIRIGGADLVFASYVVLCTLLITQNPASGDDSAVLALRSMNDVLATTLPQHTYDDQSSFILTTPAAVAASTLHGLYMPVVFGTVYGIPAQRMDIVGVTDASAFVYSLFDPRIGQLPISADVVTFTLLGGRRRHKTTNVVTELAAAELQKFTFSTTTGCIKITNSYSPDTYDFFVDVQTFYSDGIVGNISAQSVGSLLLLMLLAAGVPSTQIDLTSLAAADAASPETRGVYIAGGAAPGCLVSTQDTVNKVRTFELIYLSTTGLWTCKVWDPSFDLTTIASMLDRDILSWAPNPSPSQPVASRVSVNYRIEPGSGRSVTTTASSTESSSAILQTRGFGPVASPYVDDGDGIAYAQRLLNLAQQPPVEVDVTCGPAFMTVQIGDKFRVQRARGPLTTTPFDQVMEVISFTKMPATMQVQMRLSNMRGLGESVRRVPPPGTAAWGSATADQKRSYLYAVDDTQQRASAGDAASFRPGRWW